MAKKKGLASLVKAPRNTTIKGQPHMLAYITGSEADALKRLGGSGDPGPMGIPAFFFDFDEGGVTGEGKDVDYSPGPDDGLRGGQEPNRDTGSSSSSSSSTNFSNIGGSDDEDDDQGLEQDKALASFLRGDYKDTGGPEGPRNFLEKKIIDKVERGELIDRYEKGPIGEYTGYYSTGYAPGIFGVAQKFLGIPPGQTYTGFGKGLTDSMSSDNSEPSEPLGGGSSGGLDAGEAAKPAVTPDNYYQRGVGTQTMDLADATQRDAFLAGLYGTTPSPIGSRLDREKGLLYLPDGTVVDIRTGKKIKEPRISGLDIFKPLQTYVR